MPTVDEMKLQLLEIVKKGDWKLDELFQFTRSLTCAAQDLASKQNCSHLKHEIYPEGNYARASFSVELPEVANETATLVMTTSAMPFDGFNPQCFDTEHAITVTHTELQRLANFLHRAAIRMEDLPLKNSH